MKKGNHKASFGLVVYNSYIVTIRKTQNMDFEKKGGKKGGRQLPREDKVEEVECVSELQYLSTKTRKQ